jgi:hypothetical protein
MLGPLMPTSVKWEVFRAVKDWSLTALNALNAFRRPSRFTDGASPGSDVHSFRQRSQGIGS